MANTRLPEIELGLTDPSNSVATVFDAPDRQVPSEAPIGFVQSGSVDLSSTGRALCLPVIPKPATIPPNFCCSLAASSSMPLHENSEVSCCSLSLINEFDAMLQEEDLSRFDSFLDFDFCPTHMLSPTHMEQCTVTITFGPRVSFQIDQLSVDSFDMRAFGLNESFCKRMLITLLRDRLISCGILPGTPQLVSPDQNSTSIEASPHGPFADFHVLATSVQRVAATLEHLTKVLTTVLTSTPTLIGKVCDMVAIVYDVCMSLHFGSFYHTLPTFIYRIMNVFGVVSASMTSVMQWLSSLVPKQILQTVATATPEPHGPPTSTPFNPAVYFVGAIGSLLFASLRPHHDVRKVLDMCTLSRNFSQATSSFADLLSWVATLIPECVANWIVVYCPFTSIKELLADDGSLRQVVLKVQDWTSVKNRQRASYEMPFQNEIIETRKKFLEDLSRCTAKFVPATVNALFTDTRRILDDIHGIVDVSRAIPSHRKAPYVICLFGDTGIGKSALGPFICQDLCPPCMTDNAVYHRNPNLTYWESYSGQFAIYYDDIGLTNFLPEDGSGAYHEILNAKTNAPWELDCAFGDKGKKHFSSQLLVCNTNRPYWNPDGLAIPETINRRRDVLIHVTIDEHMRKADGTVDESLIDHTTSDSVVSHYRFQVFPATENGPINDNRALTARMRYPDLRQYLAQRFLRHMEYQNQSLNDKIRHLEERKQAPIIPDDFATRLPPGAEQADAHGIWDSVRKNLNPYNVLLHSLGPAFIDHETVRETRILLANHKDLVDNFYDYKELERVYSPSEDPEEIRRREEAYAAAFVRLEEAYNALDELTRQFDERHPRIKWFRENHATIEACFNGVILTLTGLFVSHQLLKRFKKFDSHLMSDGSIRQYEVDEHTVIHPSGASIDRRYQKNNRSVSVLTSRRIGARPPPPNPRLVTAHGISSAVQLAQTRGYPALCVARFNANFAMTCYFVKGRMMIIPGHFFFTDGDVIPDGTVFQICSPCGGVYNEYFDYSRLVSYEDNDIVAYMCSLNVRPFRNSIKHFISEEDLLHHPVTDASLLMYRPTDFERLTLGGLKARLLNYRDVPEGGTAPTSIFYSYHGHRTYLAYAWRYDVKTQRGDCGSLLVSDDDSMVRKFLGLHVCGTTTSSWSELVTKEQLERMEQALLDQGNVNVVFCPPHKETLETEEVTEAHMLMPAGNFSYIGECKAAFRPRQPTKTEIVPSILHGRIFEPTTAPSILSFRDPRMLVEDCDFMRRGIEKFGGDFKPFPKPVADAVHAAFMDDVERLPADHPVRVLTLDEAVAGLPNQEFFDCVNPKSSLGFYYIQKFKLPGSKGKSSILTFDETTETWNLHCDEFRVLAAKADANLRRGKMFPTTWTPTPKDERRSLQKNADGNCRIFTMADFLFTAVGRRYFLSFIAATYKSRHQSYSAVGIDAYSPEWTSHVRYLLANSPHIIGGDLRNCDGSIKPQVLDCLADMANFYYDLHDPECSSEDNTARHVIMAMIAHAICVYGSLFFMLVSGNPSGCFLTVIINTTALMYYHRAGWMILVNPPNNTLHEFASNVAARIYGDDCVISVTPEYIGQYNFLTFQAFLAEYGIDYTMPDKTADPVPYQTIHEVTFLKNYARKDGSYWKACLDKKTIHEMLNWTRECPDPEAQCIENCQTALRFAYFWGKEYFNWLRSKINEALREIGALPSVPLWTYEERDLIFLDLPLDFRVAVCRQDVKQTICRGPSISPDEVSAEEAECHMVSSRQLQPVAGPRDVTKTPSAILAGQVLNPDPRFPQGCCFRMANTRLPDFFSPSACNLPRRQAPVSHLESAIRDRLLLAITGIIHFFTESEFSALIGQSNDKRSFFDCAFWTHCRAYIGADGRWYVFRYATFHDPITHTPFTVIVYYPSAHSPPEMAREVIPHMMKSEEGKSSVDEPAITTTALDAAAGVSAIDTTEIAEVQDGAGLAIVPRQEQFRTEAWDNTMALGRSNLFATLNWTSTTDLAPVPGGTFVLPDALLANNLMAAPFATYATWSCDKIRIHIELAGNQFFQGQLVAIFFPGELDNPTRLTSRTAISQMTRGYLDASRKETLILELPWTSASTFLYTSPVAAGNGFLSTFGVVELLTWHQLYFGETGGATSLTVNCRCEFVNVRFGDPLPAGSDRFVKTMRRIDPKIRRSDYFLRDTRNPRYRLMLDQNSEEAVAHGNTYTTVSNNYDHISGSVDNPIRTDGSTIAPSLDATIPGPTMMDNPSWTAMVPRIWNQYGPNLSSVIGPVFANRLSMYSNSQSVATRNIIEESGDIMDFRELVTRYSYTESNTISGSVLPGSYPITFGIIAPMEQVISAPPTIANPAVNFSIADNIALVHDRWRGTIRQRLSFVMSGFHELKVVVCAHYGQTTVPATLDEAMGQYYHIISVYGNAGPRVFEVEYPFFSSSEMKKVPFGTADTNQLFDMCCGTWSIWLYSALNYTAQVQNFVVMDIYTAMGEDTQFQGVSTGHGLWTCSTSIPPSMNRPAIEARPHGGANLDESANPNAGQQFNSDVVSTEVIRLGPKSMPYTGGTNHVVTEFSRNLADVIRSWSPLVYWPLEAATTTVTGTPPSQYGVFNLSETGGNEFNVWHGTPGVTAYKTLQTFATLTDRFRSAFRYLRGSQRFYIELVGSQAAHNSVARVKVALVQTNTDNITLALAQPGFLLQLTAYMDQLDSGLSESFPITGGPTHAVNTAAVGRVHILDDQHKSGIIEIPFDGCYTKIPAFTGGSSDRVFWSSIRQPWALLFKVTYDISTTAPTPMPSILISHCAGDDFRLIRFIGFPQSYLQILTDKSNNKVVPYPWGANFYQPAARAEAMAKKGISNVRRGKRLPLLAPSDDEDSGYEVVQTTPHMMSPNHPTVQPSTDVYDPNRVFSSSYGHDGATTIDLTRARPNTTAHFLAGYISCAWTLVATGGVGFNRPNVRHCVYVEGTGYRHMVEVRLDSHSDYTVFLSNTFSEDIEPVVRAVIFKDFEWYLKHANEAITVREHLGKLVYLNSDPSKNAISLVNEICQQTRSSIEWHYEADPSRPPHSPEFSVTGEISMPDGDVMRMVTRDSSKAKGKTRAAEGLVRNLATHYRALNCPE